MVNLQLRWSLLSNTASKLYVYLPISDGNQQIKSIELSSKPSELFKDKYYSYAKYQTDGNFSVSADIQAKVRGIDKYRDINDKKFLANEPILMMGKTKKFTKGLSSAREVYDWIQKNIGFPPKLDHYLVDLMIDDWEDLNDAIENRKAMCGGKSRLFVSMCRNIGIPARSVTGYFMKDGWTWLRNAKFHKNWMDLHVWAEFYKDGWWIPVDCNIAQQMKKDYFGKFPEKCKRIAISKGSYFLVDGKVRHSLQTAHFDRGKNLKVSLKSNS